MTVLAATSWRDNASLIADAVAPLGYIKPTDRVIDVTYGRGLWWKKYQHAGPFEGCLDVSSLGEGDVQLVDGDFHLAIDYRKLPMSDNAYDVVVFDPPYVAMGGRKTSGLPDFMDRFGLEGAASTPALLQADNMLGLMECARITKPGGLILVKCANYISSGRFWPGVHETWICATQGMELEQVDEFTMVGHSRAQPPGRRQMHARNNSSTLFVFRKPKPRRSSAK